MYKKTRAQKTNVVNGSVLFKVLTFICEVV